jgi:hypothetical protein
MSRDYFQLNVNLPYKNCFRMFEKFKTLLLRFLIVCICVVLGTGFLILNDLLVILFLALAYFEYIVITPEP